MNEITVSDNVKGLPGNGRNGDRKEFLANSQPGCQILLREEFQAVVKHFDGISSRTPPQPLRADVGLSDRLSGATAWPEAAWTLLTFNVAKASSTLSPPSDQELSGQIYMAAKIQNNQDNTSEECPLRPGQSAETPPTSTCARLWPHLSHRHLLAGPCHNR